MTSQSPGKLSDHKRNRPDSLAERDRALLWHPFTQMKTARNIRPIVQTEAALLIDDQGKQYIDAIGSWWVNLHGHSHPHIAAQIAKQAAEMPHVMFAGFTHSPAIELCERLQRWLPGHLEKFFFSDNGSTAIEIALKMALQFQQVKRSPNAPTQPMTVVAFEEGYHGDTFGSMAVGERDVFVKPFEPYLFDVSFIPAPLPGQEHQSQQSLKQILDTRDVAAFVFEPLIQGAGGMRMYEAAALDSLLQLCRNQAVLTIADEVMTGFFKTGTCFATHQLKQPVDFICLSKALTSGTLPLALTVTTDQVFQAFYHDDTARAFFHGHSYTANPVGCAAALASLDLIEAPGFKKNVKRVESYLADMENEYRREAKKANARFVNVRHRGIVFAMELNLGTREGYLSQVAPRFYELAMNRGVLVRPLGEVVYVIPPVCISNEQLDFVFQTIDEVAEEIMN